MTGTTPDQLLRVLSLATLVLGTLLALWVERLDVLAVAVAVGGAASWLLSSASAQGGLLLELRPGNGLTVAHDPAVGPAAVLVGVLRVRRLGTAR